MIFTANNFVMSMPHQAAGGYSKPNFAALRLRVEQRAFARPAKASEKLKKAL
jgi:hypothetical protein